MLSASQDRAHVLTGSGMVDTGGVAIVHSDPAQAGQLLPTHPTLDTLVDAGAVEKLRGYFGVSSRMLPATMVTYYLYSKLSTQAPAGLANQIAAGAISPVTVAPDSVGVPVLTESPLAPRSTSSKTTVAPGSPSIEGIRSVVPASARNCLPPVLKIA